MAYKIPNPYSYLLASDPMRLLMSVLEQSLDGYNEARSANEERYNTILDRDLATRNRLLDYLKNYGDSMISDTNRDWNDNLQNSLAHLSQTGMLGSTVRSAVEARNERERGDALKRIKDTLTQNAMSVDERASNRLSDFQERRVDNYPTNGGNVNAMLSQLMGLMNQNAQLDKQGVLGRGTVAPAAASYTRKPASSLTQMRQADTMRSQGNVQGDLMARLHQAINDMGTNSLTRQERINSALEALTRAGYAQYDPAQGIPIMPGTRAIGWQSAPSYVAGQNEAQPYYGGRVPLWQRDAAMGSRYNKMQLGRAQAVAAAQQLTNPVVNVAGREINRPYNPYVYYA